MPARTARGQVDDELPEEPPDDDEPPEDDEPAEDDDVLPEEELLDDEDVLELLEPPALLPVEAYRSEYQPPPFRMNPAPREICRRAVAWWQVGHSVSGASLMDCSASHSWAQEEQAYSYVGMVTP